MRRFFITFLAAGILALGVAARQPQRGYRGFIEWSSDVRSERLWDGPDGRSSLFYSGFATSHGRQFNPLIFVGAGLNYEYYTKNYGHILAPFVQGRIDLLLNRFTPFGDIRLGYNLTNGGGVYFSPNVGYRFNWGRKVGINLGVGLTVLGYTYDKYRIDVSPDEYLLMTCIGKGHGSQAFFTFKLGFDF